MHNLYRIKWKKGRNRSVLVCPYLDRYLNKTAYILRAIAMRVLPETRMDFSVESSCMFVYWNSEDTRATFVRQESLRKDTKQNLMSTNYLHLLWYFLTSFSMCYKIGTDKKQRFGDDRKGLICKKFRRTFFLKAWKLLSKKKKHCAKCRGIN